MLIDPQSLANDLERVEQIEKASLRMVVQAIFDFRETAAEIFQQEPDKAQDKAEDITREAMDTIGVSKVPIRLFGKIDYKRARYLFHSDYALKQALLVDSKAEKDDDTAARLQLGQTSLRVLHRHRLRTGVITTIDEQGMLPTVLTAGGEQLVTTTILVKYFYEDIIGHPLCHRLRKIMVAGVPNGMLQTRYNPSETIHIWRKGPHSTERNEDFRTRLDFGRLAARCPWRYQEIPMAPATFTWNDAPWVPIEQGDAPALFDDED